MKASGVIAALVCGLGVASAASAQKADPLSEKAAVYVSYVSEASALDGRSFKNAGELNDVLSSIGSYKGDQIGTGWVAYSSLVAAKQPEFRKSVREMTASYGADVTSANIKDRKWNAAKLDGGDDALRAVLETTQADFAALQNSSDHMREQYYVLEKHGWGKSIIPQKDKNQRISKMAGTRSTGRAIDPNYVTQVSASRGLLSDTNADALSQAAAGLTDTVSAIKLPAMFQPAPKPSAQPASFSSVFNEIPRTITGTASLDIIAHEAGGTMPSTALIEAELARPTSNLSIINNKLVGDVLNLDACVAATRAEADLSPCLAAGTRDIKNTLSSTFK
ncbi:MAG: hypothetical protein ACK4HR_07030 [Hyphomonas sp.]|jgi:hypothetical protein